MAYKFQLGAAVLSGSAKFEDGLVSTDVDDTTAANVVAQIDDGEIAIAKLAAKTISGKDLGQNLDALSVDDSSIEYSAGSAYNGSAASTIRVKALGVTNAMLAGSIANAKLANSTISGVALGGDLNSLSKATNGGVNFSSYNGSAAVSNLQLDLADLAAADVNVGADSIAIVDADDDSSKKETIADLMTAVAGNGLAATSGVLSVGVDDSSVELNSDALRVKALGVTNAMLAGSIANAKLANSAITIAGTSTSLGGSITAAAILNTDMGGNFTIGNQSDDTATFSGALIVSGDLTVNGTTTTVDTTNLLVKDKLITLNDGGAATTAGGAGIEFEEDGSVTGFIKVSSDRAEFELQAPANNNTLTIDMDAAGELEFTAAKKLSVAGNFTIDADITSNASEINLLDAITRGSIIHGNSSGASALLAKGAANTVLSSDGTDISYAQVSNAMLAGSIVDSKLNTISTAGKVALSALEIDGESNAVTSLDAADLFIVDDGAGGSNKKMAASVLKTFIGSGVSPVTAIGDANATLAVGINAPTASAGAPRTWTLPDSSALTPGEAIIIKAYGNAGTHPITIARGTGDGGNQEIDGVEADIVLESDSAAVTLYYVATNTFVIV